MMKFHLQFPIPEFEKKINYRQKIFFVGSCFSENIGELFVQHKIQALINPHGIQFNPWSVSNSIHACLLNQTMNESELFFANEVWNSWLHHSRFSKSNKNECLKEINSHINNGHAFLIDADWLVITLGSSYGYKHIENNKYVANCHKVPQKEFSKQLFTTAETIALFEKSIHQLREKNNQLKIIFTVSPVRYIRDGVMENNLSKARLIDAVHSLVNKFDNCYYFPAYELVIDDLRDYRFFESDLVHPNQQAIHYVFDKFIATTVDDESKLILEKIKEINTAKNHRPFDVNLDSHKTFKKTYLEKCMALKKEHAFLNMEKEIAFFGN